MNWNKQASDVLLGKKIVRVRYLTDKEADALGWYSKPVAFLLDNGIWVYPSADDEGNNGGALFTSSEDCPVLPLLMTGDITS